jgi:hypothetical protein
MLIIEEHMEALAADNAVLKADNAVLKADNAAMKVQYNVTSATGKLELFVDGRTNCPEGTLEVNVSKGRAMISRPHRGKTGAVFNRPFDANEIGRTPKHSHDVDISDKGHTHAGLVVDPGHTHLNTPHSHPLPIRNYPGGTPKPYTQTYNPNHNDGTQISSSAVAINITTAKTGISIENSVSNSGITASVQSNAAGEHFPQIYVLVCQRI